MAIQASVRFKADDIWDAPENGKRYEVIDGELYVTPAPDLIHQTTVGSLHDYIGPFVRQRKLGKLYPAPTGLVLDDENGLQPDLIYVSNGRARIKTRRGLEGAPDLVVEVLSPSTRGRDFGIKLRRYAAAGVPHYWIVDPDSRHLLPYRLTEDGYELIGEFGAGTVFQPELFPGLEIPIDELWL
ncbi:MAG: Uma2 family endonuclease [Chloroflexi bacterium]|nr:Uma2 family endonuclease [Chloroflexota bacterium]